MNASDDELRSRVFIIAYDADDCEVLRKVFSFYDYYEDLHPLIDEDEYRAARAIRRMTGEIYNSDAKLTQRWENFYGETGEIIRGRAVHDDGTVTEFPSL